MSTILHLLSVKAKLIIIFDTSLGSWVFFRQSASFASCSRHDALRSGKRIVNAIDLCKVAEGKLSKRARCL